ncbi:MAG: carotene biosynthesis protein [Bacteroidetes bacterium MED-G21]|nr:MAG: carotene biosynthesis protein [Bacteroidetes bacterium MED-G21]
MNLKLNAYIGLVWLFTISGILGIISSASAWFLALTPLHLTLNFLIVILCLKGNPYEVFKAISIPLILGFTSEVLGVNFDLIYGSYTYGENLGLKIFGVPIVICLNWCLLTIVSADVAKMIVQNKGLRILIGALLMMFLDMVIEVSAPRFDFWVFKDGIVPLQNYIAWFIVANIAHWWYQSFSIDTNSKISCHIMICMFVFFSIFLIL